MRFGRAVPLPIVRQVLRVLLEGRGWIHADEGPGAREVRQE